MSLKTKMFEDMKLRGLCAKTQEGYVRYVAQYASYFGKSPDLLTEGHLRRFLLHLKEERQVSSSTLMVAYSGLKFFYQVTLPRPWAVLDHLRVKKERRLPVVLSQDEVRRLLLVTGNLKHRTILTVIYSAGLRVSEAVHLRVGDIDGQRLLIRVVQGKNRQDRYVMLGQRTLAILRDYHRQYRPTDWLFPGQDRTRPLTTSAVLLFFKRACVRAGIRKPACVHSLRHSFATHLMEAGVNMRYIQTALGHRCLTTTARYTQVCRFDLSRIKSPIDTLEEAPAHPVSA